MKTLNQVIQAHSEYSSLIRAVIRRIGMESVEDVNNHGVAGGFNGFIYYADTNNFFDHFKKKIVDLVEEYADELGEEADDFIRGFNCLNPDPPSHRVINMVLYGNRCTHADVALVKNALAWFAAEVVCSWFMEE